MCVAIVKPVGKSITDESFNNCYICNQDGFGFSYIKTQENGDKQLMVFRTMNYDEFLVAFRAREEEHPESPFLIHFRATSKGLTNLSNCHPFAIDSEHVFIHNGTIHKVKDDPKKEKSDTSMFNTEILGQLPKGWFGNPIIKMFLKEYVLKNRIAIMNVEGEVDIINEDEGEWEDGVWYSNSQYKWSYTSYNQAWNSPGYTHENKSKNSRKKTVDTTYPDDDDYSDCDWTKHNMKQDAYHGQIRLLGNNYRKFDFYTGAWVSLRKWEQDEQENWDKRQGENTYVPELSDVSGDSSDSSIPVKELFELDSKAIDRASKKLCIPSENVNFSMKLKEQDGTSTEVDFKRCGFCWQPDYAKYIQPIALSQDEVYDLCDACSHNMVVYGMITERTVEPKPKQGDN